MEQCFTHGLSDLTPAAKCLVVADVAPPILTSPTHFNLGLGPDLLWNVILVPLCN